MKNRVRRFLLWMGLVLIVLLAVLSVFGAFLGADLAQRFFNSIPMSIYWLAFAALLLAAIASFRRLLCIRGLFLIHLGCILVLLGAIWGSQAGFKIRDAIFKTHAIRSGQMVIHRGETQNAVASEDSEEKTLPFAIKLVDFRLEYYEPGYLLIQTADGEGFKMPAKPGSEYLLGPDLGSVEIVRRFENFKLLFDGDKKIAVDDPNGGPNPALELRLKLPDGGEKTKYVFERFAGHTNPGEKMVFSYLRMVKDYISDVEVVKEGKSVARKSIEVNNPLHFAGFLFYQHAYDSDAGRYTVLAVANDSGLVAVYLGFILLCAGAFWHLWLRNIFGDREIED
ncbi:MAG: cytochrome c biogenesis protein ResB [Sedimentisphaerales bacterium]